MITILTKKAILAYSSHYWTNNHPFEDLWFFTSLVIICYASSKVYYSSSFIHIFMTPFIPFLLFFKEIYVFLFSIYLM